MKTAYGTAEARAPAQSSVFGLRSTDIEPITDRQTDRPIEVEDRQKTEEALIKSMVVRLGFAAVDALHILDVFGLSRCEGALAKTLWDMDAPRNQIRRPRGWFLGALREGKEWTAEDMATHARWIGRQGLEQAIEMGDVMTLLRRREDLTEPDLTALAASTNPQLARLAREETERRAGVERLDGRRRHA